MPDECKYDGVNWWNNYYTYRKVLWEIFWQIYPRGIMSIVFLDDVKITDEKTKKLIVYRCIRWLPIRKIKFLYHDLKKTYTQEPWRFIPCQIYMTVGQINIKASNGRYLRPVEIREDMIEGGHRKLLHGCDLILDVDGPTELPTEKRLQIAHQVAGSIIDVLKEYKVGYSIVFSGGRGFHIYISNNGFLEAGVAPHDEKTREKLATFILSHIKTPKGIQIGKYIDPIQLIGVPYTLHGSSGLVRLPLTKKQFENFDLALAQKEHVLKLLYRLSREARRGLVWREGHLHGLLEACPFL